MYNSYDKIDDIEDLDHFFTCIFKTIRYTIQDGSSIYENSALVNASTRDPFYDGCEIKDSHDLFRFSEILCCKTQDGTHSLKQTASLDYMYFSNS